MYEQVYYANQFYQYHTILTTIHDSNGKAMSSSDMELISSFEMDKTDKFIRRLMYNEG